MRRVVAGNRERLKKRENAEGDSGCVGEKTEIAKQKSEK